MALEFLTLEKFTIKYFWMVVSQRCIQLLVVVPLVLSSFTVNAFESDGMFCSHSGAKRKIFIETENAQSVVPCQVVENKRIGSPDAATSLWSAGDDAGYCKRMLDGYIEKLRGLGFECWSIGNSENTQISEKTHPSE